MNRLLNEDCQIFEIEQQQVLRVGLETAKYIHTDDTGARHKGKNGYCTVIGNEFFTYFKSSDSKSRQNFLEMLHSRCRAIRVERTCEGISGESTVSTKVSRAINLFRRAISDLETRLAFVIF